MSTDPADPPRFPESIAAQLGHFLVRFQALEARIAYSLICLLGKGSHEHNPLAHAIVNQLSFGSLVRVLATVPTCFPADKVLVAGSEWTRDFYEEGVQSIARAVRLATEAETHRNRLVHSQWLYGHITDSDFRVIRTKLNLRKGSFSDTWNDESAPTIQASIELCDDAWREVESGTTILSILLREHTDVNDA